MQHDDSPFCHQILLLSQGGSSARIWGLDRWPLQPHCWWRMNTMSILCIRIILQLYFCVYAVLFIIFLVVKSLSHVQLLQPHGLSIYHAVVVVAKSCNPIDTRDQALLSAEFSRHPEYWVGCHFLFQGISPTQRPNQVVLVVKNLPASAADARDLGSIPRSQKSPWNRKMATCSSILAWEIVLLRLQPMGSQRAEPNWDDAYSCTVTEISH